MRKSGMVLTAIAMAAAAPALAQPKDLQAKPGKEYKHKATGLKIAAALAGLERATVTAFGSAETDIGANYWSADGADNVTVFLYRNVSGSVPVWFDRGRATILLMPEKYRNPQSLGIRAFTPRGQDRATGLMEIFRTESQFQSTGVILFPVNGFYAKIRASSKSRDGAGLEQLMLSAVNAVDWRSRRTEAAAAPVKDCAAKLPDRSPAKLATMNSQDRMMSALIGGVIAQADAIKSTPSAITYCRETGPQTIPYGIYRPDASNERYMMAIRDAGRAIYVGSSDLTQILSEMKTAARYSISLVDMERTATFGDFQSLPLPDQALEMVEKTAPLSVASTWGDKKRDLTINTSD